MSTAVWFCHPSDATIDRDTPGFAKLYDADGELLHEFNATMSDRDIQNALVFANRVFVKGVRLGHAQKAREIRLALEIPDPPRQD